MKTPTLLTRLTVSYSLIIVLATLLISVGVGYVSSQRLQNTIGQSLAELSFTIGDRMDRDMFYRFRDLKTLVTIARDRNAPDSQFFEQGWLEELQENFPFYKWIGFASIDGEVLVSTGGLLEGLSVSARPWFQQGLEGVFFGDVHEALLLERLLPSQSEPWRFVDVAVPVRDSSGTLLGVLGAHLSWEWVVQVKDTVLQVSSNQGAVDALVVSADNTVLLGPEALQDQLLELPDAGPEPSFQRLSFDGHTEYLTGLVQTQGHRDYPGLGWKILVRQETSEAFASVRRLQLEILLLGLAVAVALYFVNRWNASTITQPLHQISHAAMRLRAGHTQAQFPQDIGYREGQDLVRSLQGLTRQLLERERALVGARAELEQRVDERTTELQYAYQSIQDSEARLKLIADNVPVMIAFIDDQQRCHFVNRAFLEWYEMTENDIQQKPLANVISEAEYTEISPYIDRALAGERVGFDREVTGLISSRYLHSSYIPQRSQAGDVQGVYITSMDITERKQVEKELQHQSDHDILTGLPNRTGLKRQLELAQARARRSGKPLSVMFLDLDHFKEVNDTLGHAAGDLLLQEISRRLRGIVRKTDTVARLGGDEFVMVLEDLNQDASYDASEVARKLISAVAQPVELGEHKAYVSASLGVVVDSSIHPVETLLEQADAAMYQAKQQGRNDFRLVSLSR
jgi:diguanylate cyclase (GGDEF)-like protein/PAS domain S-box-containing protein